MSSSGAHTDLTWSLMCDSAMALQPSFASMAQAGATIDDAQQLRDTIGALGRQAEARMMQVTGGVNTHRGAIWALGLLVTAAAQHSNAVSAAAVTTRAAHLAVLTDRHAAVFTGNKGEVACRTFQVGGARAQACLGFPVVTSVALPALQASRERGDSEIEAQLNALLAVMAILDDTCILSRGGLAALAVVQQGAASVVAAHGVASAAGAAAFRQLEQQMLSLHVSPGGAADMLAAALFLDGLSRTDNNHTDPDC
jgi:triphosphoribosyl-dephospho-CoA synthase